MCIFQNPVGRFVVARLGQEPVRQNKGERETIHNAATKSSTRWKSSILNWLAQPEKTVSYRCSLDNSSWWFDGSLTGAYTVRKSKASYVIETPTFKGDLEGTDHHILSHSDRYVKIYLITGSVAIDNPVLRIFEIDCNLGATAPFHDCSHTI